MRVEAINALSSLFSGLESRIGTLPREAKPAYIKPRRADKPAFTHSPVRIKAPSVKPAIAIVAGMGALRVMAGIAPNGLIVVQNKA